MACQNKLSELSLLALLALLWGGAFTLIKVAVETVPPATIVLGRLVPGALLLLALVRIKALALPSRPAMWGAFLVQGILQSALPFTLISWGEQHIDSGLAGLLNSTPPLFAFLITFFVLGERGAPVRKFIGVAIGLAGVLAILGPDILDGSSASVQGQLAVTGASMSYALAAVYARRFSGLPPLVTAACSLTMAAAVMLPVAIAADHPWTLTPAGQAVASIAALGVLSTALAMVIYFRLVRTLGALGVTSGSYLRAGLSIVLGMYFLNEPLFPSRLLGLFLIFASVAIITGTAGSVHGGRHR